MLRASVLCLLLAVAARGAVLSCDGIDSCSVRVDFTNAVAGLSTGGGLVATAVDASGVHVWSDATGVQVKHFPLTGVTVVQFSADGSMLYAKSQSSTVHAWDTATWSDQLSFEHTANVEVLAVSPSGAWMAIGCDDATVTVYDATTGAFKQTLDGPNGHGSKVDRLAFSPDSQYLVTGERYGTAKTWRYSGASWEFKASATRSPGIYPVSFLSDSASYVSWKGDYSGNAYVIDAETGTDVRTLNIGSTVFSLSPDDRLAVLGSAFESQTDVRVMLFQRDPPVQLGSLTGHTTRVSRIALLDNSRAVTCGGDQCIVFQNEALGPAVTPAPPTPAPPTPAPATPAPPTPAPHTPAPPTPAPATPAPPTPAPATPAPATPAPPTPAPATPAPATPAPATPAPATPAPATSAPATPAPPTPAPPQVCEQPTLVRECEAASVECVLQILHFGPVRSVAFSPDGTHLAGGSDDQTVRIFAAATGQQVRRLGCVDFTAHDIAYSPDGSRISVGGSGGRLVVCDTSGAKLFDLINTGGLPVTRVSFSRDGNLVVSTGGEAATRVFDLRNPEAPTQVASGYARAACFSPDGSRVATIGTSLGDSFIEFTLANLTTATVPSPVLGDTASLGYSPSGGELMRGFTGGKTALWSFGEQRDRLTLSLPSGILFDSRYTPDGKRIAAAGISEVALWSTVDGSALGTLVGHTMAVHRLSFSSDSTKAATAGQDGRILIWDLSRIA